MKFRKIRNPFIQIILLAYLMSGQSVVGQNVDSESFLYPIEINDSLFSENGKDWNLANVRQSQYFLLGKKHSVEHLGHFKGFTLTHLSNWGYNRLDIEIDSWTINKVEDGDLSEFISKYPHSVTFGYDGELRMIQNELDANVNLAGRN